jgi:hypothetical protein
MTTSEISEISDGMVLDAMNQLRDMNEKRDKEVRDIKNELADFKKQAITAYGVVRLIDMIYKDQEDQIPELNVLIETLRDYLSQFAEENFNIEYDPFD